MWCTEEIDHRTTLTNPFQGLSKPNKCKFGHFDRENLTHKRVIPPPPLLQSYPNLTKPDPLEGGSPPPFLQSCPNLKI